jgi:hypothetical protein
MEKATLVMRADIEAVDVVDGYQRRNDSESGD